MAKATRHLMEAAVIAAGTYFFDPDEGRRRRGMLRGRLHHLLSAMQEEIDAGLQDLANRLTGVAARVRGALAHEQVDDDVLVERVRAKIGRVISHPRAVHVTASGGEVTLDGVVLAHELDALMRAVRHVRGVKRVKEALAVHERPDGIPSLQGGNGHAEFPRAVRVVQRTWSPAARLVTGVAGGALMACGLRHHRALPGVLSLAAGVALLVGSGTNAPERLRKHVVQRASGEREAHERQAGERGGRTDAERRAAPEASEVERELIEEPTPSRDLLS